MPLTHLAFPHVTEDVFSVWYALCMIDRAPMHHAVIQYCDTLVFILIGITLLFYDPIQVLSYYYIKWAEDDLPVFAGWLENHQSMQQACMLVQQVVSPCNRCSSFPICQQRMFSSMTWWPTCSLWNMIEYLDVFACVGSGCHTLQQSCSCLVEKTVVLGQSQSNALIHKLHQLPSMIMQQACLLFCQVEHWCSFCLQDCTQSQALGVQLAQLLSHVGCPVGRLHGQQGLTALRPRWYYPVENRHESSGVIGMLHGFSGVLAMLDWHEHAGWACV